MALMVLIGIFLFWNVNSVVAISSFVQIKSSSVTVHMNELVSIPFSVTVNNTESPSITLTIISDDNIAKVDSSLVKISENPQIWNGTLNVTGVFLGISKVRLEVAESQTINNTNEFLTVTVVRQEQVIDKIFNISVIICVSILYINFGCAIDWDVCKTTLKRPVGPAIGLFCQFVFMPLMSYCIGYFVFPNRPDMQIGMFFTGISPSGGASNIYTVLFNGNLNLSVTMTTLCTIFAFGMMPFWIFTLGRHIFAQANFVIPYSRIAMFVIGLIVPLTIGLFIQKKYPRLSNLLIRIMKPFAAVLIVFIIIFAIFTNYYLFHLLSFKIIISGLSLPLAGFVVGLLVAWIFKQPVPDIKAISIETGIQNTGVAIFLLRFALPPPVDDLTTVIPVSNAMMTPVPLIIAYIIKLILNKRNKLIDEAKLSKEENSAETIPKSTSSKPLVHIMQ